MRTHSKFVVSGLFLIVGAALWWTFSGRNDSASSSRAAAPEEVLAVETTSETSLPEVTERSDIVSAAPQLEPVEDIADRPDPMERVASVEAQPRSTVHARFVDSLGNPWPDVRFSASISKDVFVTSDASGRVELEVAHYGTDTMWSSSFVARRDGCATKTILATLTPARPTHLGDILLGPGSSVFGRTLDIRGRAVPDAEVGLSAVELDPYDEEHARRAGSAAFAKTELVKSNADGSFVLEGVEIGLRRIWARGEGTRYGWTEPFTVFEGRDVRGIDVIVPDRPKQDLIKGVVTDPSGAPLARARLGFSFETESMSSSTSTGVDEKGRFEILVEYDVPHDLTASDPEHQFSDAALAGVAPGTHDLELRLREPFTFDVRLRGPAGEAIEHATFEFQREVADGHTMQSRESPTHVEPGLYRFTSPSVRFAVIAKAPNYASKTTELFDAPRRAWSIDLVLDPAQFLRGRVVADTRPASGAKVSIFDALSENHLSFNGFNCVYEPWATSQSAAREDGTFEIPFDSQGEVWVRAELAGWAPADVGPFRPSSAGEVVLTLTRGGSIEGVVLVRAGAVAEGTIVGINRGDGLPRTMRAGPGGRFRFDGLTPGPWQVVQHDRELDPSSSQTTSGGSRKEMVWSCEVQTDRTTKFDLDLTRP